MHVGTKRPATEPLKQAIKPRIVATPVRQNTGLPSRGWLLVPKRVPFWHTFPSRRLEATLSLTGGLVVATLNLYRSIGHHGVRWSTAAAHGRRQPKRQSSADERFAPSLR